MKAFSYRVIGFLFFVCLQLQILAQDHITVAVAANMQYAIEALKSAFVKESGVEVSIISGSSGKLTQQIISGAPFDIFISADTAYPKKLLLAGLAAEPPRVYARGVLVLWSIKRNIRLQPDLQFLKEAGIKSIALATPRNAPYGSAAEALLKKYHLYAAVKPRLVFGESIIQASQFIATGAADVGFTAKSIVLSNEMKGKGTWVGLIEKDYPPIHQAAVLLNYGKVRHPQSARKFYDFLFSQMAKEIIRKFGYII